MKNAIITGATGVIGTALTRLLIEKNFDVLIITREESKRNSRILVHPHVNVLKCDFDHLDDVINNTGKQWDYFFHLMWAGASGDGRNDMYLQNKNVKVALDAVKMAKRFGCFKFIGAGSQAEYGRCSEKLKPKTPVFPETGYGYAKLCAGLMTREFAHQIGIEHNWIRVLSVFGLNDGDNSMMANTIRSLKAGVSLEYTKGDQIWDYLYSKDAARAFFFVAEKGIDGKIYVLGSGKPRKLSEYLISVKNIIAPNVELKLGVKPYSEKQVMYLVADITDLTKDTGFKPEYRFEDGIRDLEYMNESEN